MTEGRRSSSASECSAPVQAASRRLRPFEQHVAGQGVPVGAQARGRQADDHVARLDPLGPEFVPRLDGTHREAGDVQVVGGHDPGVLGRLAADQGAPGEPAALVDARHDRRHLIGIDLAGGDVVEHEEGLGPEADQVVDAHGHQVDAYRVVAPGALGHHEFGAHAVGRRDQDRVGETGRIEREPCPEAADAGHEALHLLDRQIAGADVHAGPGVGRPVTHGGQSPGSAA